MNADNNRFSQALARELSAFRCDDIVVSDGSRLRTFECGPQTAPPLIIVNPIGVPILLVTRLARRMSGCFRVICWEQRGVNAPATDFFSRPHDFNAFVTDLVEIAERSGVHEECPMIGVCSGATQLVRAAATGRISPTTLVLVSPMLRYSAGYQPSQYDLTIVPYMRAIAAGRLGVANQLLEISRRESFDPGESEDAILVKTADRCNLQSLDALRVYAATASAFAEERCDADLETIEQQVCIISARGDRMISPESVRHLPTLMRSARLREYAEGGHHAVFLNEKVREQIYADLTSDGTL
jgi:pimeloyl-ACP methyl ester carboxylesterase